jgi:hypothetical protein
MVGGVFGSIGSFGSFQLRTMAFGKFFLKQTGFEGVLYVWHVRQFLVLVSRLLIPVSHISGGFELAVNLTPKINRFMR